jgi:alpha-L-fucosidase
MKLSFTQKITTTKALTAGILMPLALARGQAIAETGAAAPAPIAYATMQVISNGDSDAVIAEKAAKVLPRSNQTDWMRLEWTFFLHFGPNSFHGVEWGSGREEPSLFNPAAFDADQWLRAMKEAGGRMIVLVCKHHDGLCLWPTRYTSHSVASSPWLDGKGDEVRAVADAAHKYGLKLGVYLSPADLYQLRTNPKNVGGYYGDGSSNVLSVIPTESASFKSAPSKVASKRTMFGKSGKLDSLSWSRLPSLLLASEFANTADYFLRSRSHSQTGEEVCRAGRHHQQKPHGFVLAQIHFKRSSHLFMPWVSSM